MKRLFDPSVFAGMERQNRRPGTGFHAPGQHIQEAVQYAELIVDFDAQRHKYALQSFFMALYFGKPFERGTNDICQLPGGYFLFQDEVILVLILRLRLTPGGC